MTMKITDQQEHERALERIAELRARGEVPKEGSELAELEAAVAGYSAMGGQPEESKGRPPEGILEE
jgi:hypothetical protein